MNRSAIIIALLILAMNTNSFSQPGCTDFLASNYNSAATINDGSCLYPASSISPLTTFLLDSTLSETSGLIKWNGTLWTHNDNTDINLYTLDTTTGSVLQSYPLTGTSNEDWEEISQDSNYVYVGDFGNNANGNRTDLKILRIEKNSLLAFSPVIDTISFSYSDQTNFTPTGNNNTDFDCESFIVSSDSIYLFTKQWVTHHTNLYVLPKIPGTYVAQLKTTFDVQGLITGAVYLEDKRFIALSGYTSLVQPFVWLLYDFTGSEFFGGNKRQISISLPFHQIEGITSSDGLKFYMTNENLSLASTPQKFHIFDFNPYLSNYLDNLLQNVTPFSYDNNFVVYPNPASEIISINQDKTENYIISNAAGEIVISGILHPGITAIKIEELPGGIYCLKTRSQNILFAIII